MNTTRSEANAAAKEILSNFELFPGGVTVGVSRKAVETIVSYLTQSAKIAEALDAVCVLPLTPSDVIVVKTKQPLSMDTSQRLKKYLSEALGVSNKILVLSDGLEIGIMREMPPLPTLSLTRERLEHIKRSCFENFDPVVDQAIAALELKTLMEAYKRDAIRLAAREAELMEENAQLRAEIR